MKMSLALPAALFLLAMGCSLLDHDGNLGRQRISTVNNRKDRPTDPEADTNVYVTAIEFDESYWWQRDTAGDAEPFRLSVYKNGRRTISIQGGPGTNFSRDPDMHRFIDGHLYSDYSSNSGTVVSRDGQELFRYEGREMIYGLLVEEDTVYTLGQSRGGKGLSLRRNGEMIYSNDDGIILGDNFNTCSRSGALYRTGGSLCFCYYTSRTVTYEDPLNIYVVRDGKPSELKLATAISKIYDMRVINGKIHLAASTDGSGRPILLFANDEITSFSLSGIYLISNCKILWHESDIFLKTDFSFDKWSHTYTILWDTNRYEYGPGTKDRTLAFYLNDVGYAYVSKETETGNIMLGNVADGENGRVFNAGDRYQLMNAECAALCGESFYAGLSPYEKNGRPLLVKNSVSTPLDINGYILSVWVE